MNRSVGRSTLQPRHRCSWHGGALVLELPDCIAEPSRCLCSHWGIRIKHTRCGQPGQLGGRVVCLDHMNPFDLGPVPARDGVRPPTDHAR